MRVSRVNFKPSLLSYAIAVAAAGLAQQATAVELCSGETTIVLSGAAADASCYVDQEGASVSVPRSQTFASRIALDAPGATVSNAGTVGESVVLDESGFDVDVEVDANALVSYWEEQGAITNTGTLRAGISGTIHATGEGYTDWVSYSTSSSYSTYYPANASIWAEANAVELNGIGAAQISNSGTIEALVDLTATADYDDAYGYVMAQALVVNGNQSGPVTNSSSGVIRANASFEADYGSVGAIGLLIEETAAGGITNAGRISATATSQSDGVATVAVGAYIGGVSEEDFVNSGVIEATAAGVGGDRRLERGPGRSSVQAAGVLIGYEFSSSDRRAFIDSGYAFPGLSEGASFSNSGRITAQLGSETSSGRALGVGIGIVGYGSALTNAAGGVIEALAGGSSYDAQVTGLAINSLMEDAVASNAGLIRAQVSDSLGGAYATGVDLGGLEYFGEFNNSGTISADVSAAYYARANGMRVDWLSGDLNNTSNIEATAAARFNGADALGVYVSGIEESGRLVNDGIIRASAGVQTSGYAFATGVRVNELDGELINRGTISAKVFSPNLSPLEGDGEPMPMDMGGTGGIEVALKVNGGYGTITNEEGGLIDGAVQIDNYNYSDGMALMAMGPTGVTLSNAGRIALSGSAPNFVYGSYYQLETGELDVELRNADGYGGFYATLADFTEGNRVVLSVDPLGQIADGDTFYGVVSADTLVKPNGFDVSDSSLFWDFDTEETETSLNVTARYLGVGGVLGDNVNGLTGEQQQFAEDLLLGNLSPEFAPIVDALNRAPDADAALDVLEAIGPALSGAAGFSARGAAQGALKAISARLNETRGGNSGDAFQKNAVWIKPFLGVAEQDEVNGINGYDVNTAGFVLGVDGDISDNWRVGVGVASSMTDVEGGDAGFDVDSVQLSAYASYALSETAALDLDLSHVSNSFDSTRRIPAVPATAVANYDGRQFALGVAVSNRVAMGEKASFVPSAQVRYNRFRLDGYTETGAGALNLTVAQASETSVQWLATAGFEFAAGPGTLAASVGAGYDTLDAAVTTASFAGGGPLYASTGIKPDSTVLTGGLGYRYVTAKSLEINAAYDLESRGSEFMAQTLSVKFRLPF